MSVFPCVIHGARIKGSLGAAYVSALHGTDRRSRRLRVCSPCLAEFLTTTGSEWVASDLDGTDLPVPLCSSCSKGVSRNEDAWAIFATVYPPGAERRDYFGSLHVACAEGFIDGLELKAA